MKVTGQVKKDLTEIALELARDVKSRKFLLTIAFIYVVVYNKINVWNLSMLELGLIIGAVSLFMIIDTINCWIFKK